MRTITTTAGTPVELDGDVLAVIEAISRDLTRRKELEYGFDEVDREFQRLVTQLTDDELRVYLKESLFMSFNRFEADRMMAIMKKANNAIADRAGGSKAPASRKGTKKVAGKKAASKSKAPKGRKRK